MKRRLFGTLAYVLSALDWVLFGAWLALKLQGVNPRGQTRLALARPVVVAAYIAASVAAGTPRR